MSDAPVNELRVCISGSRGYRALWKVDQIIRDLPPGAVVVHGGAEGVDRRAGVAADRAGLRRAEPPARSAPRGSTVSRTRRYWTI